MFLIEKALAALILPPTGPVLLALFGLWLAGRQSRPKGAACGACWRYGGFWLAISALLALLVLSLPLVGNALLARLEVYPPISPTQLEQAQAIVILGGGSYYGAPEYGGDTVSPATLERLRYAARLARDSRLPLLVTGGAPHGGRTEAESMKEVLERDFGVSVRWTESRSRNTAENAAFAATLLKTAGITRIALVSHGWHLPRAVALFEHEALRVTAAPTAFSIRSPSLFEDMLPGGGLGKSRRALREYLGHLVNQLTEKP